MTTQSKQEIAQLFAKISPRYDLINRLMTFGLDFSWRKKAALLLNLQSVRHPRILDLACGTGDFILAVQKTYPTLAVTFDGLDVCAPMIEEAKVKMFEKNLTAQVRFHLAPMEDLPFSPASFDGVTVGFGIRNAADRQKALSQMFQVLKPGGRLVILEALPPENAFFRFLQRAHMRLGVLFLGRLFSDVKAYQYLGDSVAAFPSPKAFCTALSEAGFDNSHYQQICLQSVTLFSATKP